MLMTVIFSLLTIVSSFKTWKLRKVYKIVAISKEAVEKGQYVAHQVLKKQEKRKLILYSHCFVSWNISCERGIHDSRSILSIIFI
ncbi:hypothetical protein A0U40_08615 [[Bacillus] sp. KCTC 13219]|nr:hypothetical protein A0U40_08615 [[Bacillus] sp. KCTC 13219]